MNDVDMGRLAAQFMDNAVEIRSGERIWIEYEGAQAEAMARACEQKAVGNGAVPRVIDRGHAYLNSLRGFNERQLQDLARVEFDAMKQMDGYIRVCDSDDPVPLRLEGDEMNLYQSIVKKPYTDYRVRNTRWLVVSAPTEAFARACKMKFPAFEKFYMGACLADYKKMRAAADPLTDLLIRGRDVHVTGKGTDLRMSIAGIGAKTCAGKLNIPDGECFTAPVKDSVNGTILFGPSKYQGQEFASIALTFRDGKIIDAKADTPERTIALNKILDRDEGSRYVGEFAIAFNPSIMEPVGDILFDEKINGSLHMAMGQCYEVADNGNESVNHWDMVHIQRPEHGGGEIWIDGELIRKDGRFIRADLLGLNPENLNLN